MSRAEVDTTRPFRSVKEAVAIFGERILASDTYSHKIPMRSLSYKPVYAINSSSSSVQSFCSYRDEDEVEVLDSVKKLEAELEETKKELNLLKERETETEMAVASLNAKFDKNMTKTDEIEEKHEKIKSERWGDEKTGYEYLPTLAEALRIGDIEDDFLWRSNVKTKKKKKKPIIPLLGDMFSKKKVNTKFADSFSARSVY